MTRGGPGIFKGKVSLADRRFDPSMAEERLGARQVRWRIVRHTLQQRIDTPVRRNVSEAVAQIVHRLHEELNTMELRSVQSHGPPFRAQPGRTPPGPSRIRGND
jgi:hypothetical protein